jgi:DNA-binding CsgD family transcriptional regulator/PAS domain-containing protein
MAMHELELLSALIGDIYDAALDPTVWNATLPRCADFVGGRAAALFFKDAVSKSGGVVYNCGIDPYFERLYFEKIIKLDPLTTGHFFAEIEEPVAVEDILPYDEFIETRAYREWGQPQGIIDVLNVALDKTPTSAAMFCVFRHWQYGRVDDEMRRRMRLIVPHIRRAVLIGKVIDLKRAEAASLADTLDGISAGMFLVDETGRIVHANAAGHAMVNTADVLRAEGGRLVVNDHQADQALADTFETANNGDATVGIRGVSLLLAARDGHRYLAHVLPLTSGARRKAGTTYAAAAALFVHKAALYTPSPPEAIAKAYKLTPMELRVLLAIVEVGGVPEVAEALGIAETTVRTHLGRVYSKGGVARQADLVRLVAEFSNPLVT